MEPLPKPNRAEAERLLAEGLASKQAEASRPTTHRAIVRIDLGERAANCSAHGAYRQHGYRLGKGVTEIWSGCAQCEADKARAAEEEQRTAERQRAADRRAAAIGSAAIPPRFHTRDFAAFVADTKGKQRALTVARDYAEQFDAYARKGQGLIFSGLPGTGKSHLAASIMLHLIDGRRWVQYITCMALIRAVRETWRRDSEQNERRVLAQFGRDIDLLVIDEVGVQYGTDGEQTILFEILDKRYSEMRPTILLTNQDKDGFKTFVGERVFDRLTETSRWIPFDWASYRPTARRESQA